MSLTNPDDWTLDARCRGLEDALFPDGKDQKRARALCTSCPVRSHCLAEALDHKIEWGVWGGLTERERRQLLRQRPGVTSWHAVLLGGGAPVLTQTGQLCVDDLTNAAGQLAAVRARKGEAAQLTGQRTGQRRAG
ncbi:hypothetical protein GCM10009638_07440 [Luteococcus sanguinis]